MTGSIPYTWKQIEEQIKDSIICLARVIEEFGPGPNVASLYLGIDQGHSYPADFSKRSEIDLTRHNIYQICKAAYNYAYQISFTAEDELEILYCEICTLLEVFPQGDQIARASPFSKYLDAPLLRMLETYCARYTLFIDVLNPSVRDLSLLANMTVPDVITSFGLDFPEILISPLGLTDYTGSDMHVDAADATAWLTRQRNFIPQSGSAPVETSSNYMVATLRRASLDFSCVIANLFIARRVNIDRLSSMISVDQNWIDGLLAGSDVEVDVSALHSLAIALETSPPEFVGAGVTYLLERRRISQTL